MYQGAHFPDCRHLASTFTSSTLATLATGAWPSQHGIVADSWLESGVLTRASSESLLATTFTAQVAAPDSPFRAWIIGPNPSHTALVAGTTGASQYFRSPRGQFTTFGEPPTWLVQFNTAKPIDAAQNAKWMAINAAPTAPPLRTLTYNPEHQQEFLNLYEGSPFAVDSQFDLLAALLDNEKLGQDKTDFVCLILNATDVLGYETGARSPLQAQLLLSLDRNLDTLLTRLSKTPGDANFAFAMVGGHGAPPAPPNDARSRMAVNGEVIAQAIDKYLAGANAGRVRRYIYPFLYLDPIASRDPETVRAAAGRAAMAHPAVAGFYTAGDYCSTRDAWETRYRNSFHPKRSGDVMLSYKPEYVEDYQQCRGISYGSLYNYDVRVPLFLYGPQFRAGIYDAPVESIDVAPTLARLLGVDQPSSCTGRVLSEAFVP